jgi:hypothetical protein
VQTEEKFIGKWRVRKGYKERERETGYAILMIAEVS